MSPVRAAQRWPHIQLCAGWLGRSGITLLCVADRLVTMAEGNTILYGSQMVAGGRATRLDPALGREVPGCVRFSSRQSDTDSFRHLQDPVAQRAAIVRGARLPRARRTDDARGRTSKPGRERRRGIAGIQCRHGFPNRSESQKSFDIAAPKLAACILRKPLTLSEITQINLWSSTSEALMLYDWIMTNSTSRSASRRTLSAPSTRPTVVRPDPTAPTLPLPRA